MMGTGKSFWTKKLSKKLKTGGYDLDHLVESHEEKTIAEIFAEDGEVYFRKSEARLLRWFGEKKSFILATGGGAPCFHENMEWMNKEGVTVWIDEPVDQLVERLVPEKAHRPLISHLSDEELYTFLTGKLAERMAFYRQAAYHLEGDAINDESFAKIIRQHV